MEKQTWPAWRYGPNGAADIFDSESAVPAGWKDHPSKVGADKPAPRPTPLATGDAPVDADGWPFDPKLHAATKTQTKAGLWRMKVGVSRPAAKPGFPKPVLDL